MPKEPGAGPLSDALAQVIRGRIYAFSPPWSVDELADRTKIVRKTLQTRMTTVRQHAIRFRAEEIRAIALAIGTTAAELVATAEATLGGNHTPPPFAPPQMPDDWSQPPPGLR